METLIIVALVLWFIPTIVAVERKHQSALAIFLFNLFFGWTGVCWLLALIWACTGNTQANMTQLVYVNTAPRKVKARAKVLPLPQPTPQVPTDRVTEAMDRFYTKHFA